MRDPNQLAADVDNININSPDAIERERQFEYVRLELHKLFEQIDTDHNGQIDRDELVAYMLKLTGDRNGASGMSPEEAADLKFRYD